MNVSQEEYVRIVGSVAACVVLNKNKHEVPALNTLKGRVSLRVHNRQQDSKGGSRRYRSASYVRAARKTTPLVNMDNTGDLRRDCNVYRDTDKNNSLGFSQKESIIKIAAEEKRNGGKALFLPSPSERTALLNDARRFIRRNIKQCLNN